MVFSNPAEFLAGMLKTVSAQTQFEKKSDPDFIFF